MIHGTKDGFDNGCKCDECLKNVSKVRLLVAVGDVIVPIGAHGTRDGAIYYRCRCDDCIFFWKNYSGDKYRNRKYKNKNNSDVRLKTPKKRHKKSSSAKNPPIHRKNPPKIASSKFNFLKIHQETCTCPDCSRIVRNAYHREYNKSYNKSQNDKIAHNLRSRLYQAIKSGSKAGSAVRDLGCSISEFRDFLESKFISGMSWENYGCKPGCWSIDHIIPP